MRNHEPQTLKEGSIRLSLSNQRQVSAALRIPGLSNDLREKLLKALATGGSSEHSYQALRYQRYQGLPCAKELQELFVQRLYDSQVPKNLIHILRYLLPEEDGAQWRNRTTIQLATNPLAAYEALRRIPEKLQANEARCLMEAACSLELNAGQVADLLRSNYRQLYFFPIGQNLDKLLGILEQEKGKWVYIDCTSLLCNPYLPTEIRERLIRLHIALRGGRGSLYLLANTIDNREGVLPDLSDSEALLLIPPATEYIEEVKGSPKEAWRGERLGDALLRSKVSSLLSPHQRGILERRVPQAAN